MNNWKERADLKRNRSASEFLVYYVLSVTWGKSLLTSRFPHLNNEMRTS